MDESAYQDVYVTGVVGVDLEGVDRVDERELHAGEQVVVAGSKEGLVGKVGDESGYRSAVAALRDA